jgi:serine/threonine-protein kinase
MNRDEEIFADALELPPEARAAFVAQACAGDAALQARVEALLAADAEAQLFLEPPPAGRARPLPEEKAGDVIDRYILRRKIGEGGCGVVWLAEQTEPLRRQVALKVIKLGMDTRAVIARFEAERQALALMDHPDIARVLDAGATAAGRPFFVMEYVDGVPITRFCDERQLSTAARLELFARVCLALQHAHQKGIIHRDVKPSNVLVALGENGPVPKVIDFGIAKATAGRLTEHTLRTGVDQLVGTPAYMSPEQAEWRELDIDTRSDIYSLGVLLYELLAGRPPYDPQSLVRAGLEEIRRIIREVDPPRPSTALSTLGEADRATIAQRRAAAPGQLRSALRGDLDWIVMRCLEKDRARRYRSAHELADDIRRHLRQEPVAARPPHPLYRAHKFIRRHRLACGAAAACVVVLVAGTVVSWQQAVRATRAEQRARAGRAQAEELLTFMLGEFRTEIQKVGKLSLLDAVGDKALGYFAALDPRDLTDTALSRQARALYQIGDVRLTQGRYGAAEQAFTISYRRAAALAARHPQDADLLFERAQAEYWIGVVHRKRGEQAAAAEWFGRYHDSAVALVALRPGEIRAEKERVSSLNNLAVSAYDRGDLPRARAAFLEELAALEPLRARAPTDTALQNSIANTFSWLGSVAEYQGELAEAAQRFAAQVRELESLAAAEPGVPAWRFRLANAIHYQVELWFVTGHAAEARAPLARAQALLTALTELDPANQRWAHALQNCRLRQADLAAREGDLPRALALAATAQAALATINRADVSDEDYAESLAAAWRAVAAYRAALHQPGATAAVARALDLEQLLPAGRAASARLTANCARTRVLAGQLARAEGDERAARAHWQRAWDLLADRATSSTYWRVLDPAIRAAAHLGRLEDSRTLRARLERTGYVPAEPWP